MEMRGAGITVETRTPTSTAWEDAEASPTGEEAPDGGAKKPTAGENKRFEDERTDVFFFSIFLVWEAVAVSDLFIRPRFQGNDVVRVITLVSDYLTDKRC